MIDRQDPSADDELFELLANPRRRLLLYHLFDRNGGVHLGDLSREIVDFETDGALDGADDEAVTSVYVSLYQTHIPALEDHGIVEYDAAERVVRLGERADDVGRLLQDPEERERRWASYYLLAALASGTVVLADVLHPVGVPNAVVTAVVGGTAVALALLAVGHYYAAQRRQPPVSAMDELSS